MNQRTEFSIITVCFLLSLFGIIGMIYSNYQKGVKIHTLTEKLATANELNQKLESKERLAQTDLNACRTEKEEKLAYCWTKHQERFEALSKALHELDACMRNK
jgi:hypothetical protein